ncbi:rho guanine nucleotide exchange factor 3-like isoform X2 [Hypanus sabinus]|uniref:rho guanine nucleotide exchange factor 3-like isoform X2 n=1 Tax=Hypanus sabinus TaxID=79690 RepID=UPI0028C4D17A|nr:rho guanine nucleotide exchange factor 3-like isoform X2 [Hypanus sabinus]
MDTITEELLEGKEGDEGEPSFVPRERSYTSGSLSDLGKKRKQETAIDEDVDEMSPETEKEPSNKRVKPVSRLKRFSQSFQRLSFRTDPRSPLSLSSRHGSRGLPVSNASRDNRLWSETFDCGGDGLTASEVKRQEAYYEPMLKLNIMSEEELAQIFGSLYSLIPLHEDLLSRLEEVRNTDGTVREVGRTLLDWLPSLAAYETYCCNQVEAKAVLDAKRREQRVDEFLQLCQQSAFSRKLDLWSFLDLPRSRLVKYPLLLREIGRHTPAEHPDHALLHQAMELSQRVAAQIDERTGESECRFYWQRLRYLSDTQPEAEVQRSRRLWCHGELRNNKGAKLRVFLFERALVVTRPVTQAQGLCYQVYRTPIPVGQLVLEDLPDGETRIGGSIRGAFGSTTERARNVFRVSFRDRSRGQAHTLQASDSFNKQQWVSCIRQAIINCRDSPQDQGEQLQLQQIAALTIDSEEPAQLTDTGRQQAV